MSYEKAQEDLSQALMTTFYANLLFLSEYDKKLYHRVDSLSEVINTQEYKERYQLEFIQEDGDFDIYDKYYDKYLYNKKPKKYNDIAVSSINNDKKGIFSIFDSELFSGKNFDIMCSTQELQEASLSTAMLFNDVHKYVEVLKDTTVGKKNYKSVDKFIFIGTLCGRHIPRIAEKVKAKNYFVCESNLEIFRLSLFVVDYTILANNSNVRFCIMEDKDVFKDVMGEFLIDNMFYNHTLKFYTTDHDVVDSFNNILNTILAVKPTVFNHNMVLHNVFRNLTSRVNQYPILQLDKLRKTFSLFNNKPVIIVGAGPSLGDNIEWLKENQDKFVIASMGASFQKLINNDIKPDIIFTLDASYEILTEKQFSEEACKKIQDTIVIASVITAQGILDRFNQDTLFLYEVLATFKDDSFPIAGFSIGEITFQLLMFMNVKELYLLGTDLAVHQESGDTHIEGDNSASMIYELKEANECSAMESGSFSLRDDLVKVKGNFEKEVWTSRIFITSLFFYNNVISQIKNKQQNIYNLCNHGAYINGTIPTKCKDIKIEKSFKKDNIKKKIVKELSETSSNKLNNHEKVMVQNEIDYIDEVIEKLQNTFKDDCHSYKEFKKRFDSVQSLFLAPEKRITILVQLFTTYFGVINTYIDFHFNDTKLKKEDKKIQKIQDLWKSEVLNFLNLYKEYLENTKK